MVKKILFILFSAVLFSAVSFAQDISATASVDTSDYMLGDYIHFTVQIRADKHNHILLPAIQDSLKDVDVIKSEGPLQSEKDNKRIITFKYILSRYDSAEVTIPPIPVRYRTTKDTAQSANLFLSDKFLAQDSTLKVTFTNSVTFTIHAVKVSKTEDIKDIKAPVTIPLDWKIIALWVLLGLIVLAGIIYAIILYRRKKAGKIVEKKVYVPPHVTAMAKLHELDEKKLWQKGEIKEYHSEITGIIRQYFEDRFKLPALELTTSEVIDHLKRIRESEKIREITYNFLANADLVKFAKFQPMSSINEEMMNQAEEIVKETTPRKVETEKEEEQNV